MDRLRGGEIIQITTFILLSRRWRMTALSWLLCPQHSCALDIRRHLELIDHFGDINNRFWDGQEEVPLNPHQSGLQMLGSIHMQMRNPVSFENHPFSHLFRPPVHPKRSGNWVGVILALITILLTSRPIWQRIWEMKNSERLFVMPLASV